ncbi:leucine--tRNA ligase, cytoplasmic [Parachaetomium inaequale]|uniref:Leucine--tRNA ligase, cytoplasmic n=1 Tax=Parachaetomium inaequale TaxID=2588326 RepID=A0AAN6SU75_9PEZI|nr:leucine--tRNA ligase, cytoplasmic [Parachaetomium inaequale]
MSWSVQGCVSSACTKSTGNFLTLTSAVQKFGADATRISLADGSDGIDDANFEETTANATILKLFELKRWTENAIQHTRLLGPDEDFCQVRAAGEVEHVDSIQRTGAMVFWDSLFMNDMNVLISQTIQAYKLTNFKAALKCGFYDFTAARDSYRAATQSASVGMHHDCVRYYVESQALLVCIFAPHWADYIWREPSTIQLERFPRATEPSSQLQATSEYIKSTTARVLAAHAGQQKRLAKGKKGLLFDPTQDKALNIYVAKSWPPWQQRYVDLVREQLGGGASLDVKSVAKMVGKADMKRAMPFIQDLKRRLEESGESPDAVLDRILGFDEVEALKEMVAILRSTVPKLKGINVIIVDDERGQNETSSNAGGNGTVEVPQVASSAEPGNPSLEFFNV